MSKVARLSTERRRRRFAHDVLGMSIDPDGTVRVSQWVADILVSGIQAKAAREFARAFKRASRIAERVSGER